MAKEEIAQFIEWARVRVEELTAKIEAAQHAHRMWKMLLKHHHGVFGQRFDQYAGRHKHELSERVAEADYEREILREALAGMEMFL